MQKTINQKFCSKDMLCPKIRKASNVLNEVLTLSKI